MGEDRMTRWSRDQRKQDSAWATGWRATTWRAGAGALWTAGLIIGVASSPAGQGEVVVAGGVAVIVGAVAMAAGAYLATSNDAGFAQSSPRQSDDADAGAEELTSNGDGQLAGRGAAGSAQERREDPPEDRAQALARLFIARGAQPALALEVARQMMAQDAAGEAERENEPVNPLRPRGLGLKPFLDAAIAAAAFLAGAIAPVCVAILSHRSELMITVAAASLALLAPLAAAGALAARLPVWRNLSRVLAWSVAALIVSMAAGKMLGAWV